MTFGSKISSRRIDGDFVGAERPNWSSGLKVHDHCVVCGAVCYTPQKLDPLNGTHSRVICERCHEREHRRSRVAPHETRGMVLTRETAAAIERYQWANEELRERSK